MAAPTWTGLSLFASGGIGDLALRAAGVEVLVANELLPDRAQTLAANFPEAEVIIGDVRALENELLAATRRRLAGRELDVLFATPPCQGMSKNGRGKLLQGVRQGKKPELDARNQLILPALRLAAALRPRLVVFENVPEMAQTWIADDDGALRPVLEVVAARLGDGYRGGAAVVEFADYGVPQRRQRLITAYFRADQPGVEPLMPPRTHAREPGPGERRWVSVLEALAGTPPLDAGQAATATSSLPFHRVPLLDAKKHFWVRHTPPGRGAFDNQCVAPDCGFQGNPTHGSRHDAAGINRASAETPLYCGRCGALLPRPTVEVDGELRLMSGFTSAYKRMRGDLPASALTRNLSYACSDQKLHPTEHRVLSLHEAFLLHTVAAYPFDWVRADGQRLSDGSIRDMIGESIPPRGLQAIFDHLLAGLAASGASSGRRATARGRAHAGAAAART